MWSRHKKTMLAIEWSWLLIATAAVFVHLVEAWASPFMPAVWMLGVLVLFLGYRLGLAVRQLYWPQAEDEESDASKSWLGGLFEGLFGGVADKRAANKRAGKKVAGEKRRGGDGLVSTTEWIPPHIRGRKARPGRSERKQTQMDRRRQVGEIGPLELPAASGQFDGAELATVFTAVDEDTDPLSTAIVEVGTPFEVTSIVELDEAELRPETEADLSQDELVIPSFAESALSREERRRALEAVVDAEPTLRRRAPKPPPHPPERSGEGT